MKKVSFKLSALSAVILAGIFTSCSKEDNNPSGVIDNSDELFHIGYAIGTGGIGTTSSANLLPISGKELKEGVITFENKGYKLGNNRAPHLNVSQDSRAIYNLEYQNGFIKKYSYVGGNNHYEAKDSINAQTFMGTAGPRWGQLDAQTNLLMHPVVSHNKNNSGNYTGTSVELILASVNLSDYATNVKKLILPNETDTSVNNLHTWRVGFPTLLNGKVYISTAKRGYDGAKNINESTYKASMIVVDYPSLENPKFIYSGVATGENYGYRTNPNFIFQNYIYNLVTLPAKIIRVKNGAFDDSYDFDLATALNMEKVGANGMFHTGNGIAYVLYYDATKGQSWGAANKFWGVARVDLNNKTAVKLDLPSDLWLAPMQSAKVGKDGKLYMPLAPINATEGHIYIFDPSNATPTGFTKGATLKVQGDGFYIGLW